MNKNKKYKKYIKNMTLLFKNNNYFFKMNQLLLMNFKLIKKFMIMMIIQN